MRHDRASGLFLPIARAVSQFDDPAFRSVVFNSIGWAIVCFTALYGAAAWSVHKLLELHGVLAWAADVVGGLGALLLAFWLFLPCAAAIGTLYFDQIANAVEGRFYPRLPRARGASIIEQTLDGALLALKVLVLNITALILAFMLPGVGFFSWLGDRCLCDRPRPICCGCDAADATKGGRITLLRMPDQNSDTGRIIGVGGVCPDFEPTNPGDWHSCHGSCLRHCTDKSVRIDTMIIFMWHEYEKHKRIVV